MLERLFKSVHSDPELVPTTAVSHRRSLPSPLTAVPDCGPQEVLRNVSPKRRAKSVRVARLYPECPLEASLHARTLVELIRKECPDFVGRYIPKSDLERTYVELCTIEGWRSRHWTAIARQLGQMTKKREIKRGGARFIAYQLPAPAFRQRSANGNSRNRTPG